MKKFFYLMTLTCMYIAMTGCPYESNVPIDKAQVKVNDSWLGVWEERENASSTYTISNLDGFSYKIIKKSKTELDAEPSVYNAYVSMIGSDTYLNLWEISEWNTEPGFYIYKIQVDGSRMKMIELTENIDEKFTSSADLKAFIEKNSKLSFLFSKDEEEFLKIQ